jgi:hypothetical protein
MRKTGRSLSEKPLASGLPVIAYDLPEIKCIWNIYVLWIPKGNTQAFAEK